MKKYIYRPLGCIDCCLEKFNEDYGYEELNSFLTNNPLQEVYFDTMEELREGIAKQLYSIDFNAENDDIIYVHWYETDEGCPVNLSETDSDWKAFTNGEISLYRYSIIIEPSDIYLNQTLDTFEGLL
jgi:hypothetical protein